MNRPLIKIRERIINGPPETNPVVFECNLEWFPHLLPAFFLPNATCKRDAWITIGGNIDLAP